MKRSLLVVLVVLLAGCGSVAPADVPGDSERGDEIIPVAEQQTTDEGPTSTPDDSTASPTATPSGEGTASPANGSDGGNESGVDTDLDGLSDARERDIGTDPSLPDTDGDGLADGREVELGTDPLDPDTDGDRLRDGWEVDKQTPGGADLPDADPLRMDVYVQVSYADGARKMRERQHDHVRGAFKRMDVTNPDGSTGIDVHIVDDYNRVPIEQTFTNRTVARQAVRNNTTTETMGNRTGVYHHVVLVDIGEEVEFDVIADEPGRMVIVDEDELSARGGGMQYRARMVVWGLLRNVAGDVEVEDRGGWWVQEADDYLWSEDFLPDPVAQRLEREGFAPVEGDD